VLPGGVRAADFAVAVARADQPTIFCGASLGDPRKQAGTLFEGFRALRERRPEARLAVARARDPYLSPEGVALPEGAEWVGADLTADLARAYASAWVSVLPAVEEAFGLVLVESLAAGTAVVAARSGACPEIVDSDQVGLLFEPGDAGALARALEDGLELGARAETAPACRRRASDFDWSQVVSRYRGLYERVARAPA
jgi:phosphatidylinositol alpha-mannosyltransferase